MNYSFVIQSFEPVTQSLVNHTIVCVTHTIFQGYFPSNLVNLLCLMTDFVLTVRMTFTVEDYEKMYWPKLQQAINQLLTMAPGQYLPISYEQMYR